MPFFNPGQNTATNDLAGLIVGVGLEHGEIQCLETDE